MRQLVTKLSWIIRSGFASSAKSLVVFLVSVVLAFSVVVAPAWATSIYELPPVSAGEQTWVIDEANVLSRLNEGTLTNQLKKLANETGNEVRLVTIHRLDYGETIDSFADDLFAEWYSTPEAQAKQTLLVLDTLTNNVAIRTGEGVKSLLDEDIATSVVNDTIGTSIREGDKYNEAFLAASDRVVAVLSGQPDPGAPEVQDELNIERTYATAEETDDRNAAVWVLGLLVVATIIPMATYFFYQSYGG
ncbi:YgcG family protein [Oscillatoria salina IIICB1]|nr:TPM domain-containing protein [Oscillatoria salina]MBZ8182721.1 YgcG family protein [Oscillatoria salina IIICB1]NET90181.1 YgcG family protein [Kamptonema sp. SIO1D9]